MAFVNAAAARLFPFVPRPIARPLAARYIAGTSTDDAVRVARDLRSRGLQASVDILGESVASREEAEAYTNSYLDALAALDDAGMRPHVSVKPSALGSLLDWELCKTHVQRIVEQAAVYGGDVCIDMEWSHSIDGTIGMYRELRAAGLDNVAMVTQARLHRTRSDLAQLGPLEPHVRVCKGIYPEPSRIAYTEPEAIRRNYVFCLDTLLASGGYAAIATHDEALVVAALERLAAHERGRDTYEFQMLLGVRQDLAESLAAAGHTVRIYVPFGPDWHQYAARRFKESPQIIGYVMRSLAQSLFGKLGRRPAAAS
jgi:proline dehydrogenase